MIYLQEYNLGTKKRRLEENQSDSNLEGSVGKKTLGRNYFNVF